MPNPAKLKHQLERHRVRLINRANDGPLRHLNRVILPIIRRVVPQIIAQEIIGVQPRTDTAAQRSTLQALYGNIKSTLKRG